MQPPHDGQHPSSLAPSIGSSEHGPRDGCAPMQRILYAEDDPDNYTLVKRVLERAGGYEVRRACHTDQALALAKSWRPELILIDLDLPECGGVGLARLLHAEASTATIPLVAISAMVGSDEPERALRAGCGAFIAKPFAIEALEQTVAEQLQVHSPSSRTKRSDRAERNPG